MFDNKDKLFLGMNQTTQEFSQALEQFNKVCANLSTLIINSHLPKEEETHA